MNKRILIAPDFDLTLTEQYQQEGFLAEHLDAIKKHYPEYHLLQGWTPDKQPPGASHCQ